MKSQLYFFKKNLDAPLYQTVVKRRLRNDRITFAPDAPARLPTSYQFLQDNAPWHTCDDSMSELQELVDDRIIGHPAQSPDLNIMEDLWSYLDRKAKACENQDFTGTQTQTDNGMAEAAVELHSNVCTVNANPAGRV